MKVWHRIILTWALLMAFCAVSAWAFSPGVLAITAAHWWSFIAAIFTVAIGICSIWLERPYDD